MHTCTYAHAMHVHVHIRTCHAHMHIRTCHACAHMHTCTYQAGDLGFDPAGLKPAGATELRGMQNAELNNGRAPP